MKIYLSHFILERGAQFDVSLRDRWRHIYSERRLLLAPYLLPGARGRQCLHPLASRIIRDIRDASDRLRIPGSTLDYDWTQSKSDRVVLISPGPLRLHTCSTGLPRPTAITPLTNHNVTACQSIPGHQEENQSSCQQSLYNKNLQSSPRSNTLNNAPASIRFHPIWLTLFHMRIILKKKSFIFLTHFPTSGCLTFFSFKYSISVGQGFEDNI